MEWTGPFAIDQLLGSSFGSGCQMPPESDGVYLVSRKPWKERPTRQCAPLFVGSNTENPRRLRLRIGHLIADAFGFYGAEGGNSSGGQSIHEYCRQQKVSPKELYIGRAENCRCSRCAKIEVWRELRPLLNKNKPARCEKHFLSA